LANNPKEQMLPVFL